MVNIECYYSEPESGFGGERMSKQVTDLLSVMIKRKEKRWCDNDIPVISSSIQYYNDKYYDGNVLYLLPKIKNSDYPFRERHDAILTLMSSTGTIKNTTRQNTIPGYILCENPADERPDTHPENVTSAKEPKSMAAERSTAENIRESADTPAAEYTPVAEYTPETEYMP